MSVSRRARRHADRGGDPLDGLVNLFDLGIVLAVAFLLAALASLDLTNVLTDEEAAQAAAQAAQITATQDETAAELDLQPGERVVGRGEPIGTVYRLDDGRTVIVRPNGETVPGEGDVLSPDAGTTTTPDATTPTTPDTTTPNPLTPETPAVPPETTTPVP